MAEIEITLRAGHGVFSVEVEQMETYGQAWGADKSHLDSLVDEAVASLKRAYTPERKEQ